MRIIGKEYGLLDYIKISLNCSGNMVVLRVIDKVIRALIPSLQIYVTASFVDTSIAIFQGKMNKTQIVWPLICIFGLISYQYISEAFVDLIKQKIYINLTEKYRPAVMRKIASLEYRYLENDDTKELIYRVGSQPTEWIWGGLNLLLYTMEMALRVGAIIYVLATQVWWIASIVLLICIPLFGVAVKSGKNAYKASQEAAKYMRRANYLQSVLTDRDGVEERTLFSYTDELNKQWYRKFEKAYRIHFKAERQRVFKMKSGSIITVFISIIIIAALLPLVRSGALQIGMYMGLVTAVLGLVQDMSWELVYITSELAKYREYMRDFTVFSKLLEKSGATDLPAMKAKQPVCIEFKNVSFAYPDTNNFILKNLNMKLYGHKHYAFVGVNGAGKTTITKLLTGLYDNYSGEILIDGRELRDFLQAELKALFSMVYQDFARYEIPMSESIALKDMQEGLDENIDQAINLVELCDVVERLPDKINTPLGKIVADGIDLSGGEWQRVAIARAIVHKAPIYILDEPTAALDPIAESAIYEMFGKISKGDSTIFITHRLGAARLADEIMVIDDGRVAEQGTHETLIAKAGIYAKMFEAQREWYDEK